MQSIEGLPSEEFSILDFITPITARWKLVLLVTIICATAAFGITRLGPKKYQSSATIYVQQTSKLTAALKDVPIPVGIGGGGSSDYIVALLKSDTLGSRIIDKLNLAQNADFTEHKKLDRDQLLVCFKKCVSIKDNKGTIVISVSTLNPQLAADIANCLLDNLSKCMVTSSKRKANYISNRLDETSLALHRAEDEMKVFQEKNDVTLIEEDSKQKILKLSELDTRLLQFDSQLQEIGSQLQNAGELNSLVDQEVQRKAIESGRNYVLNKKEQLQKQLSKLPAVAIEYARIQRKVLLLSKTYELLNQQYQLARITQQGEDGDYQIVDRAWPKRRPIASGATTNGVIGGFVAFMLMAVLLNVLESSGRRIPRNTVVRPKVKV